MSKVTVFHLAFIATTFLATNFASAETLKGVCTVSASSHSGQKFATLKCYKSSEPGDFKIRSTAWEKDDKVAYRKMARFAGRRFTCDMTSTGKHRDGGMEISNFHLSKCK